jgi:hypothetical protein
MKLSKKSKELMLFLAKNKFINHIKHTSKVNNIIKQLYRDILESYNFLLSLKQKQNIYYNLKIKKIENISQVIKPQNFNSKSFPEIVRKHIDETIVTELCYHFSLFGKAIKIYFCLEETNAELKLDVYDNYVDHIVLWLHILNQYASKRCANSLTLYFYFTSLEKSLPNSNILILDETNVNTAFTTTCPKISEIIVFRKEEWFKVFIHETFHNFGLDFSDMNNHSLHKCVLDIFEVKSEVNLYESYTEVWAEIMNALFCSFIALQDKNDFKQFLSNSEFFINYERCYSYLQLTKTLHFMGLTYMDLYSKTEHSKLQRYHLYKEKTNVLSYYVIKTILINNYNSFLLWCQNNNISLLQFKKTISNQQAYCDLIKKNYKTQSMLVSLSEAEIFLSKLMRENDKNKNKNISYVLSNMRMSICELG